MPWVHQLSKATIKRQGTLVDDAWAFYRKRRNSGLVRSIFGRNEVPDLLARNRPFDTFLRLAAGNSNRSPIGSDCVVFLH